ncbi:SufE family protein [Pelagibius marinus]|uniref:SufE family protein n=1 Tax=Pelagibius marinus TaxID=2762760 RepID=UPI0018722BBE|nr:SufE family protein [Pelagibius marinus]
MTDPTTADGTSIDSRIEELIGNFSFLDDWEDRFRYLIDLGRKLEPMDEALKTEETKVRGCTSQVWIVDEVRPGSPPTLHFIADSDAHIVKGLIAVLMEIYDGRTPEEILAADIKGAIGKLGFEQHLSPNRANGLFSMVERIRALAAKEAAAGA